MAAFCAGSFRLFSIEQENWKIFFLFLCGSLPLRGLRGALVETKARDPLIYPEMTPKKQLMSASHLTSSQKWELGPPDPYPFNAHGSGTASTSCLYLEQSQEGGPGLRASCFPLEMQQKEAKTFLSPPWRTTTLSQNINGCCPCISDRHMVPSLTAGKELTLPDFHLRHQPTSHDGELLDLWLLNQIQD